MTSLAAQTAPADSRLGAAYQLGIAEGERRAATIPAQPVAGDPSLVTLPLREFAPGQERIGRDDDDGTIDLYGSCVDFCKLGQDYGQSVAEHGPWCESAVTGAVDGLSLDGAPKTVSLTLVEAYQHGTYPLPREERSDGPLVRLAVWSAREDGSEAVEVYLPIAEVFRLAAAADYTARAADRLDLPLRRRS